ncbi:hypothetical protein G6F68_000446 [Rhizopus microsporus]|nr:hypothetical protein G6F67_000232 [Rhizopus microsporus]KAG1269200.1 hypothetical protein G6F68_000446 [Rhizopus microsporus]
MTALFPAVSEALIHIRFIQRDLARNLMGKQARWEQLCHLFNHAQEELRWWLTQSTFKNGLPIMTRLPAPPAVTIHVDASDVVKRYGFWNKNEKQMSINVRELMAIWFALQAHAQRFRDQTIHIYSDNRTALKYAAKAGRTASSTLQLIALEIQDICNQHNLTVIYQHIPGVMNTEADALSRMSQLFHNYSLPRWVVKQISQEWKVHLKIAQAIHKSTNDAYNCHWKNWANWCFLENPKRSPTEYDLHLVVIRSALASVFRIIHSNKPDIAEQRLIQQFF